MILIGLIFSFLVQDLPPETLYSQNRDFWIEQLKNPSVDVRITAVDKLGELKLPETIEALSGALRDENADVRFHTLRSLTKIPSEAGLLALNAYVNDENDPYLKSEARRSIRLISDTLKAAEEKAKEKELKEKEAKESPAKSKPAKKSTRKK